MVKFGIWGNQWGGRRGTNGGGRQSAAFKKLSKNRLKLRLVRQLEVKAHTKSYFPSLDMAHILHPQSYILIESESYICIHMYV